LRHNYALSLQPFFSSAFFSVFLKTVQCNKQEANITYRVDIIRVDLGSASSQDTILSTGVFKFQPQFGFSGFPPYSGSHPNQVIYRTIAQAVYSTGKRFV